MTSEPPPTGDEPQLTEEQLTAILVLLQPRQVWDAIERYNQRCNEIWMRVSGEPNETPPPQTGGTRPA